MSCHNSPTLEISVSLLVNTLRPRQNGRHFPDDIFERKYWISISMSLTFVLKGPVNSIVAFVRIMSEPMMVSLLTYICANEFIILHQEANVRNTVSRIVQNYFLTKCYSVRWNLVHPCEQFEYKIWRLRNLARFDILPLSEQKPRLQQGLMWRAGHNFVRVGNELHWHWDQLP